jgi:hypothetical protein
MKFTRKYGYRVTSKMALKLSFLNLLLTAILYAILIIQST